MSKFEPRLDDTALAEAGRRPIGRARAGVAPPPTFAEALRIGGVDSFDGEPVNLAALEIGERVRMARQAAGLTQAELAELVGCKQGDLSDIERGKGRDGPSFRVLKTIAVAVGAELPVNPAPPERPPLIQLDMGGAKVNCAATGYDMIYPLYTDAEWSRMRARVKSCLVKDVWVHAGAKYSDTCQIVNVGPSQHVRFRCDEGFSVIGRVRGGGEVRVHKAAHRFHGTEPGAAVAILDGRSEVIIDTADGESCIFMAVPAGVLMAQETAAEAD